MKSKEKYYWSGFNKACKFKNLHEIEIACMISEIDDWINNIYFSWSDLCE